MSRIFITSVPTEFNELVRLYVESEPHGGGKCKFYEYEEDKQCVKVEFVDGSVAEQFFEKGNLKILSHEMPFIRAPSESTIFVYDVPPSLKDDLDCFLESARKGGGTLANLKFYDEVKCAMATFEDVNVADHFLKSGVLKLSCQKLKISNLPPCLYQPKYKYFLNSDIVKKEEIMIEHSRNSTFQNEVESKSLRSHPIFSTYNMPREGENKSDIRRSSTPNFKEPLEVQAYNIPDNLNVAHLKLILENKRFGGGPLKTFQFDNVKKVACFSYSDDEIAEKFINKKELEIGKGEKFSLRKKLMFGGESLEDAQKDAKNTSQSVFCNKDDKEKQNTASCSVELKTDGRVSKSQLLLYAENKRSKGGPVKDMLELDSNTFVITFWSHEDARLFYLNDHSGYLNGTTSTVMLDSWPEDIKPCAIKIEGFKKETSLDTLKMFFENPRSGSEPDSLEIGYFVSQGTACCIFRESRVVDNILQKKVWKIGQDNLKVVAYTPTRPPPMFDPNVEIELKWLLFTEIKVPSLNHKQFKESISDAAKSPIDQIYFFKEDNKSLIKFKDVPDYCHVLRTLCTRPIQGTMISFQKVPLINSIFVENRGEASSDILKLYFENPRSGGGVIKHMKLVPNSGSYIIEFTDKGVVDRILSQPHTFGKVTFSVRPHV